jgi:hypothetical protein
MVRSSTPASTTAAAAEATTNGARRCSDSRRISPVLPDRVVVGATVVVVGGREAGVAGVVGRGCGATSVGAALLPSARRKSAMLWKRSSGDLASARRMTPSRSGEMFGARNEGSGGGRVTCATTRSPKLFSTKGVCPHSIS